MGKGKRRSSPWLSLPGTPLLLVSPITMIPYRIMKRNLVVIGLVTSLLVLGMCTTKMKKSGKWSPSTTMMIFSFPALRGMMRRGGGFIPLVRLVVLRPLSLFPPALVEGVGFLRAVPRPARHVVSKERRWLMCTKGGGRAVDATMAINVEEHHPLPLFLR